MAAALIPLIAGLAPDIINFITSLIHPAATAAEALGTGTGPLKFATVFSDVVTALQKAAAAGTIDKVLPSDDMIKAIIQAVVTSMQLSGQLGGTAVNPAPATSQAITLTHGQTITVTA